MNSDKHQSEALQYSIEKTCRIVERLFPILLENTDAVSQEQTARAIIKICEQDEVNRLALRIFIDKYGELTSEKYNTTLNKEIEKF